MEQHMLGSNSKTVNDRCCISQNEFRQVVGEVAKSFHMNPEPDWEEMRRETRNASLDIQTIKRKGDEPSKVMAIERGNLIPCE